MVEAALNGIIARQIAAGIDIGNDGEMPRTDFVSYIAERMNGFGRGEGPKRRLPLDAQKFPIWFEQIQRSGRRRISPYNLPQTIGPLSYDDISGIEAECAGFKKALADAGPRLHRKLHDRGLARFRGHGVGEFAL